MLVKVNFSHDASILSTSKSFDAFFETLTAQLVARNPNAVRHR